MVAEFTHVLPSLDNYWRSVILFGRNVASYKFALARSLLDLARRGQTAVPLDDLAQPFAAYIVEHLRTADKQAASASSQFLGACRRFRSGELGQDRLRETTVKLGFNNVIDAFHVVGNADLAVRFFTDERKGPARGIRLTDEMFRLAEQYQARNLPQEVEARWRLVELAWELNLPRSAVVVGYDAEGGLLFAQGQHARRAAVTRCRDALNGYQKGKCFYCFADVSVVEASADLADVDHFFPHALKPFGVAEPVDGVWNLVLACPACNRGPDGKFERIPSHRYLERLHRRNEFLIGSHHPLRETLMLQSGADEPARRRFLQEAHRQAMGLLPQTWVARDENAPAF
jgi:hypothetical protein